MRASLFSPTSCLQLTSGERIIGGAIRLLGVVIDGVQVATEVRITAVAGGGAVANQTRLPRALEVLSDWQLVCVIPVAKRRDLPTLLEIVIMCRSVHFSCFCGLCRVVVSKQKKAKNTNTEDEMKGTRKSSEKSFGKVGKKIFLFVSWPFPFHLWRGVVEEGDGQSWNNYKRACVWKRKGEKKRCGYPRVINSAQN